MGGTSHRTAPVRGLGNDSVGKMPAVQVWGCNPDAQNPCKAGCSTVGVCNPYFPMLRWEVETGKSLKACEPASLMYAAMSKGPCLSQDET